MSQPSFRRRSVRPRARLAAVLALGTSAVVACGGEDPFAVKAQLTNVDVGYEVYPLSTAPTTLPAAISLYGVQSVRPLVRTNLTLNFDLAVDLDASGKVRLMPPKLLVPPQTIGLQTGFQVISGTTLATLESAPKSGYQYDSALVVSPGQVVVVQTQAAGPTGNVCSTIAPLYAKLRVDSLRPKQGSTAIFFSARVDPNCGFRSFADGLPTF